MQRARSTVLARVLRTVAAHNMLAPGMRVAVAVSGGPDSIGLLCVLAALRRKLGIEVVAAHVNHHLRGRDSDADEKCAAQAAIRLGVELVRADLDADLRGAANLEARARVLRYRALHRLARKASCARIATGHTRDDQAETVMMRLIRGSGLAGLAGIEPVRSDGVMRPLLDCSRSAIEAFVRSEGQRYRIDKSNRDQHFLRARVRSSLLPLLAELNPAIVDHLVRIATLSAAESRIVDAWTGEQLTRARDGDQLDLTVFRAVPPDLRSYIIRAWLLGIGVSSTTLTARHIADVTRLAVGNAVSGEIALRGAVISRRYDRLQLGSPGPVELPSVCRLQPGTVAAFGSGWRIEAGGIIRRKTAATPADLWTAVCDASALSEGLVVRPARSGERVRPLGLAGRHRKLSDLFIDRKVPAPERKAYPVVSCGEEIVWVPGVVRSELLRIDRGTTAVLRLRAYRKPTVG